MDTRTTLLAVAAAVVLVSAVGVVDVVVAPGEIRGETATLELRVDLRHRGSTAENVTVRYRAIDANSGLLVDQTTVDVGDVDGGGETAVNGSLDVERAGGYRLETVVYVDGERRSEQTTRVAGVSALTPAYANSPVGFTDGNVWPTVAVSVAVPGRRRVGLPLAVRPVDEIL